MSQYLGDISAYALAVSQGYTGTEEEYAELMASYATVGQTAVTAAQTATTKASEAATSATTATNKASEATTAATTATTKAGEASTSASTATSAKDTAVSASQTATTKATEATTAAATATSAKTDAVAANTAAQSAKTAAQTAQTGAETAAASVQESASQIAQNTSDISELKEDFTQMESDGVVPSAEQIISDKGITDSVPYHYRKTGGDGADRLYDQIVGGTVAWNQLVQNGNFESTDDWAAVRATLSVADNIGTVTVTSATNPYINQSFTSIANHKYLYMIDAKQISGSATIVLQAFYNGTANASTYTLTSSDWETLFRIVDNTTAGSNLLRIGETASIAVGDSFAVRNAQVFDLTAMFGTTIADYIYQLEQTTAGAGVAFFKSLFPNDYYPYDSGTLKSVEGLSAHKMTGFNQWDEEWEQGYISNTGELQNNGYYFRSKNYIPIFPETTYFYKCPADYSDYARFAFYDADKRFLSYVGTSSYIDWTFTTPANAHYMKFTTGEKLNKSGVSYRGDICINLSDPAKNGQYEPYKAHGYPLDSTLTLRGLFKLDANNNLYADGDTYEYTGKVTRNTILRAYQNGDESLANAITDGTNTVVYSANASTEQATPYQHLQQCDPSGTEEYVSTGIVPVGHNTQYPENLKAKIEGLPWNFASLIAPTESTYTATRNYTTGALFIVDNVLYKATSNIANGGTITPNTNCTATTLAEIISALA